MKALSCLETVLYIQIFSRSLRIIYFIGNQQNKWFLSIGCITLKFIIIRLLKICFCVLIKTVFTVLINWKIIENVHCVRSNLFAWLAKNCVSNFFTIIYFLRKLTQTLIPKNQFIILIINHNRFFAFYFLSNDLFWKFVQNVTLNNALHRSRTELRVVAFACDKFEGVVGHL